MIPDQDVMIELVLQLEVAHSITMHLRSREFPSYLAQAEAGRVLAGLEHQAQLHFGGQADLAEAGFQDDLVCVHHIAESQVLALNRTDATVNCCTVVHIALKPAPGLRRAWCGQSKLP